MFMSTYWIMWANDDGHSEPDPIQARSPRDAADRFIAGWPDFDGQLWVFKDKPAWTVTGYATRGAIMMHSPGGRRRLFRRR